MMKWFPKQRNKRIALAILCGLVLALVAAIMRPSAGKTDNGVTYKVRRGNLLISVLEGGNIISTRSQEWKSKVEGRATIISIVPDGTIITEEDVRNKKLLVELDSAELVEQADQQEITFQGDTAAYTQARESYDIQLNQNQSNIRAGELDVKFAHMDLGKYVGAELAESILADEKNPDDLFKSGMSNFDISARLKELRLAGDAMQRIRRLEADINLAQEELERAKADYDWSLKLGPKEKQGAGYISNSELEADRLAMNRRQVELDLAGPALRLFLQYEFPKELEQLRSNYLEAESELERIKARARSEIAKAEAELKSREARYQVQKDRLEKLRAQIENCRIYATKAGMVVYPSTAFRWGRAGDKIEEGATVRERQVILTIPDPDSMAVNVKINEASVHKVEPGQRARIVPDPFPDMVIRGTVSRVAVLPDPQHPMFSPDLKVYDSTVLIDNPPSEITPGMSAQVEIIIDRLEDVISVPIQAVTTRQGERVCYVVEKGEPQPRVVEIGQFNNTFIHIKEGLNEGEIVLLRAPDVPETGESTEDQDTTILDEFAPPAPEAPAGALEGTEDGKEATPEPSGGGDANKRLEQLPADVPAAVRERWEKATPEERARMLQRFQQGGRGEGRGDGGGRRRSRSEPEGGA